jgi:4-alpha-glucanotransferase
MQRSSGILLPFFSLPSTTFDSAYAFIDFLKNAGQKYWQILPLGPTDPQCFDSPYTSFSSFALNAKLLPEGSTTSPIFIQEQPWVLDYALFMALLEHFRCPWFQWPRDIAQRTPEAIVHWQNELRSEIAMHVQSQNKAFAGWQAIRDYAHIQGIQIIGDVPIFVAHNSADVWCNQSEFLLNDDGTMQAVAGVPPDFFNPDGQTWGLPLYRWDVMKKNNYRWWISRLQHSCQLYDLVRIDHFRGFEAYFEIPARSTARDGRWIKGPGHDLFDTVQKEIPLLPFIAEDLGVITKEVHKLRDDYELPGMRIALIEFLDFGRTGTDASLHNIEEHPINSVAYSTTHDFNTALGWYNDEATPEARQYFNQRIGTVYPDKQLNLINFVARSSAKIAIYAMQDILGLGANARINTPGTSGVGKNWSWKLEYIPHHLAEPLKIITRKNNR